MKTYYCDDFDTVVRSCPVPLVIAGGKAHEKDALRAWHMTQFHLGHLG